MNSSNGSRAKKILRGISRVLRHTLEGWHDKKTSAWNPGDLERRLNEIGVWSDRPSKPLDEMPHLSAEDKTARRLVDGYLQLRAEATFLDPAQGSGPFHLEAFDLFYAMYEEEAARKARTLTPCEIATAILTHNLYGIDIDGRSVQIATAALWMEAKERAPELEAGGLTSFHEHLVATNIRLPKGKDLLELFKSENDLTV